MMMDDILPDIAKWTLQTVQEIVRSREYEPGRFDYKTVLVAEKGSDGSRETLRLSIRKTACAMANARGGYILFGVQDRGVPDLSLKERISGIPLDRDLLKEFGDNVANIEPRIHFEGTSGPLRLRRGSTRGIYVIYVAESPFKPHMVLPSHVFYRRSDSGTNEPMGQNEVREQMIFGEERQRKVNLLRLRLVSLRHVAEVLNKMPAHDLEKTFVRLDVDGLDSLFAEVWGLLVSVEAVDPFLSTFGAAKHVNRILDYATTPGHFDHQGLPSENLRQEVRSFLGTILKSARMSESLCVKQVSLAPAVSASPESSRSAPALHCSPVT
ncbi:MAG: AlbA family DNA-binding domain-containing protein, partial [Thermomicrobiales bacterium]